MNDTAAAELAALRAAAAPTCSPAMRRAWLRDAAERDAQAGRHLSHLRRNGAPRRSRCVYDGKWVAADCTACSSETGQGNPFPVYMYEVFMPEVEVDIESGKAKVVKFTTAVDVGTIINRATVDGQIYGGLAQGIGLALTEDFEDLKVHTSLRDCGIPYTEGHSRTTSRSSISGNAAAARTVRRGGRRRSAVDGAASGDPQRHLQRLRRAHLPRAGAGGRHQAGA